eukprot:Nk52_evm1s226 gene=Nk52_evmTU1s226
MGNSHGKKSTNGIFQPISYEFIFRTRPNVFINFQVDHNHSHEQPYDASESLFISPEEEFASFFSFNVTQNVRNVSLIFDARQQGQGGKGPRGDKGMLQTGTVFPRFQDLVHKFDKSCVVVYVGDCMVENNPQGHGQDFKKSHLLPVASSNNGSSDGNSVDRMVKGFGITMRLYAVDGSGKILWGTSTFIHTIDSVQKSIMDNALGERQKRIEREKKRALAGNGLSMDELFFFVSPEFQRVEASIVRRPQLYVEAEDGVLLAYKQFGKESSKCEEGTLNGKSSNTSREHYCNLIQFHTPGFNGRLHHYQCEILLEKANIQSFNFDLRGHGRSDGRRGDCPSEEHLMKDIRTCVRFVKWNYGGPIVLSAYLLGNTLLLKYENWKEKEPVDGYFLNAMGFGPIHKTVNADFYSWLLSNCWIKEGYSFLDFYNAKPELLERNEYVFSNDLLKSAKPFSPAAVNALEVMNSKAHKLLVNRPWTLLKAGSTELNMTKEELFHALTYRFMCASLTKDGDELLRGMKTPYSICIAEQDEQLVTEAFLEYVDVNNPHCRNVYVVGDCKRIALHRKCIPHLIEFIDGIVADHAARQLERLGKEQDILFVERPYMSTFPHWINAHRFVQSFHVSEQMQPRLIHIPGKRGAKLPCIVFEAHNPTATVVFVVENRALVWPLAARLAREHSLRACIFSHSGTGTANSNDHQFSSPDHIYHDIRSCVRFCKLQFPTCPVLLGSAFFYGNLLLSYSTWAHYESPDGFIFISSPLGVESSLFRSKFSERVGVVKSGKGGGLLSMFRGDSSRYSDSWAEFMENLDPHFNRQCIECLAHAIMLENAGSIMQMIEIPVCVLMGAQDELLCSEKVLNVAKGNFHTFSTLSMFSNILEASHLDTFALAADSISQWADAVVMAMSKPPKQASLGAEKISNFDAINIIGKGAFAEVILARHRQNKCLYAIKTLKIAKILHLRQERHVMEEKRILSQVDSVFTPNMYAAFRDDHYLYMVMDYFVGGELYSLLLQCKRFTENMARFYIAEIALALEYIHGLGIVFRDLKPENVLLDHRGHIKIIDFGFAKCINNDKCHSFVGTPEYMSPQVVTNTPYDCATDIWSLGIVTYELIRGRVPFHHQNLPPIFEMIQKRDINFSGFSKEAAGFIDSLCNPDPELRPRKHHIRNHKWFNGMNWMLLENLRVVAPYVPSFKGYSDTANFQLISQSESSSGTAPYSPETSPSRLNQLKDF